MKRSLLAAAAVAALGALPTLAQAQLAFNAGVVSDYRYRGISQTRLQPAVQGGIDYTLGSFYVGTWASTVKWIKDGGGDADYEIDFYGGYKGDAGNGITYDVGLIRYQYPGHDLAVSPNTTEGYIAGTFGPVTLKYSHAFTNLFGFDDSKQSGYLDATASFEVTNGWMLAPHIGYQKVRGNGDFSYVDYSLTVSKDFSGLLVSAAIVDTDTGDYVGKFNKNLGRAGIVVGAKYSF